GEAAKRNAAGVPGSLRPGGFPQKWCAVNAGRVVRGTPVGLWLYGIMLIALHNLAAKHANLLTSIRIAREAGYAGIEIDGGKLQRYLAQGFGIDSLRPLLKETPPVGLSYVQDIERQEPREYEALLNECETICALAEQL